MWEPRGYTVFVRKYAAKNVTDAGLHLPSVDEGPTVEGEVVASADSFLKGKRVLFSRFSGSEVEVKGEKLFLVRDEDVLAWWREDKENKGDV